MVTWQHRTPETHHDIPLVIDVWRPHIKRTTSTLDMTWDFQVNKRNLNVDYLKAHPEMRYVCLLFWIMLSSTNGILLVVWVGGLDSWD